MWHIIQGDAREELRQMEEESFQCCVTSPPYWGLRSYGTGDLVWGGEAGCEHEWEQASIRRAGRDDEYYGGKRVANGVKVRQPIGSHFCRLCGTWRGSLGLEPTPELYVQHLVEIFREVRRVLRKDGTLWLNLGDSYAGSPSGFAGTKHAFGHGSSHRGEHIIGRRTISGPGLKPKDLIGIPWRVAFALQADGWWLRSDIIWSKPNPIPESVTDRPTKAHEYIFLLSKSAKYYYDAEAIAEALTRPEEAKRKTPAVFGGANKWEEAKKQSRLHSGNEYRGTPNGKRNKRTVWTVATTPFKGTHFATFPPKLVEPCILAGCPPHGLVLDPFAGSGTAMLVAERLKRDSLGIELSAEYVKLAESRLKEALLK